MPPRWTSPAQFAFLSALVPLFKEHQANKTVAEFWPVLYQRWFTLWPEVIIDGKDAKTRLQAWFSNATRGNKNVAGAGGDSSSIDGVTSRKNAKVIPGLLETRTRKRSPVQLYQAVYYKGDVKARCEEEYAQYKEVCAQDGVEPKIQLVFVNELCLKLLEDATEEVKAAIADLVKRQDDGEELSLKDSDEATGDLAASELSPQMVERRKNLLTWNENQQLLPSTVVKLLQGIRDKTGLVAMICIGGPDPSNNGKIMTMITDSEAEIGAPSFKASYKNYEDLRQGWTDYMYKIYSQEERERRSLQQFAKPEQIVPDPSNTSGAPPTSQIPDLSSAPMTFGPLQDVNAGPDITPAARTTKSNPAPTAVAPITPAIPTPAEVEPPKRRGTAYEQERRDNIARNNKMCARLGEPGFMERLNQLQKDTGKIMLQCYMMIEEEEAAAAEVAKKSGEGKGVGARKPKARPVSKNTIAEPTDQTSEPNATASTGVSSSVAAVTPTPDGTVSVAQTSEPNATAPTRVSSSVAAVAPTPDGTVSVAQDEKQNSSLEARGVTVPVRQLISVSLSPADPAPSNSEPKTTSPPSKATPLEGELPSATEVTPSLSAHTVVDEDVPSGPPVAPTDAGTSTSPAVDDPSQLPQSKPAATSEVVRPAQPALPVANLLLPAPDTQKGATPPVDCSPPESDPKPSSSDHHEEHPRPSAKHEAQGPTVPEDSETAPRPSDTAGGPQLGSATPATAEPAVVSVEDALKAAAEMTGPAVVSPSLTTKKKSDIRQCRTTLPADDDETRTGAKLFPSAHTPADKMGVDRPLQGGDSEMVSSGDGNGEQSAEVLTSASTPAGSDAGGDGDVSEAARSKYVVNALVWLKELKLKGATETPKEGEESVEMQMLRKDWNSLLDVWETFERVMGYPDGEAKGHKLGTDNRPQQFSWWLKRGRKFKNVPSMQDLMSYATLFRGWWASLQPKWRKTAQGWPLERGVPPDEDWSSVAKGGANGIFIVLVGLAWWYSEAESGKLQEELGSVVEDVLWVIQTMVAGVERGGPIVSMLKERNSSTGGVKRPSADPNPAGKKRRITKRK